MEAYGELPEHAKYSDTDMLGPGENDEISFDNSRDDDDDVDDI